MCNLRVISCLNLESLKLKENYKTLQCFRNHLHSFLFDISTKMMIKVNILTNRCPGVVILTLLYINSEVVIPAKAGIQPRITGFRVKPGMTNKRKIFLNHCVNRKE